MSRKRGKDKRAAKQAVPEEILAEGSGPNEVVEANAQSLADAASDALGPVADVEVHSEPATKTITDAWGQPIEVEEDVAEVVAAAAPEPARKSKRKGKAKREEEEEVVEAESVEADEVVEEEAVEVEAAEPTAEAQSEQALEEAVMRAEAEAELGEGEPEGEGDDVELEVEATGAALPTTAASMDPAQLKNLVEALVFAADKPVTLQRLRQLTRVSDVKRLEQALAEIAADYTNRGIALQTVSGGYQFRTNTSYSVWVQQLIAGRPVRLSRAQLETLAIVAYRQPITRPEVDEIRGVDSSATLRLLLDRSLIRVLGKKEDVGRPTLYGTTKEFLDFFSLSDLRELPTLREYSELTAESRKVMSDRLGIEVEAPPIMQAPAGGDVVSDEELAEAVMTAEPSEVDVDVEAQLAADDEAAVEAVSAVTEVLGVGVSSESGPHAATSDLSSDESAHAGEEPSDAAASQLSSDESAHGGDELAMDEAMSSSAELSSDESAHTGEALATETDSDDSMLAASTERSSDEAMSSSPELSSDESAHTGEALATETETDSDESAHTGEALATETDSDDSMLAAASELSSDGPAHAGDELSTAEASSSESMHASDASSDESAHTGDERSTAEASSSESMHASDVSSDESAHADDELSTAAAPSNEPMHASEASSHESARTNAAATDLSWDESPDMPVLAAAEVSSDASTDERSSNAGSFLDEAASSHPAGAGAEDSLDLGAPRGASQEDVIARAHDAAHDPDELADDLSHDLDASDGGRDHLASDLDAAGDDAGIAGAVGLEADESEDPEGNADAEAHGITNPDIVDASAPDRLDETDEPPAD